MALFTVNAEKCDGCGACVDECPVFIIKMEADGVEPRPIASADELCINCGHCVAVCPHGALDHRIAKADVCDAMAGDWELNPERVDGLLRSRRSVRAFKPIPLERTVLDAMLETARHAPTGSNSQSISWLVITEPSIIRQVAQETVNWMAKLATDPNRIKKPYKFSHLLSAWEAGTDIICRGAPALFLTHGTGGGASANAVIAVTYLELIATAHKLGTCWGGWIMGASQSWDPLKKILDLPENHSCQGAMMIGYPSYQFHRIPVRNQVCVTWR